MKRHLPCAEQQVSRSNLTKYCACHAERLAYLVLITYETSFTLRGATGVTIQPHQILRLSRRKTHILSPHRIWNVIYSARSNRCHHPTSPNTAPAKKNDTARFQRKSPKTGETSFPMRGRSDHDPTMIRPWSEHDPTIIRPWNRQSATRLATEVTFRTHHEHFLLKNTTFRAQSYIQTFTKYCACHEKCHLSFTKYCACHEKWHLNVTKYCACHEKWHLNFTKYCACHEKWHLNFTKYCTCHEKWHLNFTKYCACHAERLTYLVLIACETSFTVRGATGVTIQPHQILRLPRKMTRLLYRPHIWNVISNARSNRCHYPTSPNTAPATKNNTARCQRKSPKTGETSYPMPGRSDHDPTMIREWSEHENANRNPPRNRGYFSSSARAFSIEKYNVSRPILHSNLHQILRLPRKVTLERRQVLRLPRKVTLELHQVLRLPRKVTLELHQVLHLPRKVTLELHQVLRLPRKVTLELHQVLRLPRKVTLERRQVLRLPRRVTLERHQVLRLPRKVTLELHQILHLPRKMTRLLYRPHIWNVISNARSNTCHYPTSPNTAPATKNDTARCQRKSPKTGETSFPLRGRSDHDPRMIREWSDHDPSMIRAWKRKPQPASQVRLLCEVPRSIFYCKIQRFAPNLTLKLSPNTAPATKSATWPSPSTAPATKSSTGASPSTAPATTSDTRTSPSTAPATKSDTRTSPSTAPATKSDTWTSPSTTPATKSDTWTSPTTAPATKSDTWTSPSTAPATKNDSTAVSSSHMKRHFQCAEQHVSLSNLPKYCTCHEK